MKILHIITEKTLRGGTEVLCISLIKALKEHSYSQEIIVREGKPDEIASSAKAIGIPVHSLPLAKRSFRTFWGIRKITRSFKPNIIMSWLPRAAQFVPEGPWIHCAQVGLHRGLDCYERADYLIVPTPSLKKHFSALGFQSSRIAVLPHFTSISEGNPFSKGKFHTSEDAFVVLGLGRFDLVKGFDLLISAFSYLSNPNIHLWLAGEGAEKSYLKQLTKQHNLSSRIHFLGWQTNTADLLKTVDVLVVPSRQEALGLIVLEAWANKCPVIATQTPGPLHLITSEQDGLLVPLEDPKSIAKAITHLYENTFLRDKISLNGYKKRMTFYTPYQAVLEYKSFFQTLFKENPLL